MLHLSIFSFISFFNLVVVPEIGSDQLAVCLDVSGSAVSNPSIEKGTNARDEWLLQNFSLQKKQLEPANAKSGNFYF